MGSPISGLVAEILLQALERTHIKPLLDTKHILYTRYIDDILIIYDAAQTNLDTIIRYANSINSNLELNPTPENNNRVNFLDLAIIRNTPTLRSIYSANPQLPTPSSTTYPTTHKNTS